MLSARQLLIFKYIVEEYIATAEPVGSKLLMTKYKLPYSSATIRNEMSYLEELGFLEKTHTSSGRIPSRKGYHYYVEVMLEPEVEEEAKSQLVTVFQNTNRSLKEIIEESCQMLSELTHLTTVALGNDSLYEHYQNITIIPLSETSVTAIIVTDKGHVENRNFQLSNQISLEDLNACVDIMNQTLIGTPINEIIGKLERDIRPIMNARVKEHELLFNAFLEAFMKFAQNNVYFSGKDNMLYQPEFNDINKLRQLVNAFENAQQWRLLAPKNEEGGVVVRIGAKELPFGDDLEDVSVISTTFKTGENSKGSISVIGPTRMPYDQVVSLVEFIGDNIEKLIKDSKE